MTVSRRLVAVFAADVEGYSRLMGADEVGTLKGLTERRAILGRLIGEHRGRIANTAGDSVLAEFGSAVEAVHCAVEAQTALTEANASLPADKRINFRIGIHIGDVMVRAGDLFGDGVNIAARLQALALACGIYVSGATYEQVRKVLPVAFTDMGLQQVKNIEDPIRVYAARSRRAFRDKWVNDLLDQGLRLAGCPRADGHQAWRLRYFRSCRLPPPAFAFATHKRNPSGEVPQKGNKVKPPNPLALVGARTRYILHFIIADLVIDLLALRPSGIGIEEVHEQQTVLKICFGVTAWWSR